MIDKACWLCAGNDKRPGFNCKTCERHVHSGNPHGKVCTTCQNEEE